MITVIGAGPGGGFAAYLLAKAGFDVQVFEEHGTIGEPVACTGVITGDVLGERLRLPKELIVNRTGKARIISPGGKQVEVRLKNNIIIDRAGMDRHIARMAEEKGARFYTSHRFGKLWRENGKAAVEVKDRKSGRIMKCEADYVIGADGPISSVAKSAGIYGNRKFYSGIQVTVPVENEGVIEFYPSEQGIAWLVPESRRLARVGIAANREANSYFKRFMTERVGEGYEKKIVGWQAGPIPLYNPSLKSVTKDGRVLLVGDAATMVKAPTLGGINQSLIAAEAAAEAIISGKGYHGLWKKRMGRDLWLSLMMRKAMERFSNRDYDKLAGIFSKEKNKKILEGYDRDVPSKFALKLIMQEPGLLMLAGKALF